MDGFVIAGKAFCVCEDLRMFAEKHKGKTLNEVLRERRLEEVEAKQFGMTLTWKSLGEYRKYMNIKKEG